MLQSLLQGLRCQARPIDDGSRLSLHLAGVLVNNFTNHLYYRASVLTAARPQAHEALVALAEQALAHFRNNTNLPAQTGPARRNDSKTLKKHLTLIKKDPELSGIYLSLSRSIRKTYHP